jgi:hypothetical protein
MYEDYQERVFDERDEIENKIVKLATFLFSNESKNITYLERENLINQLYIMMEYSKILRKRISKFI